MRFTTRARVITGAAVALAVLAVLAVVEFGGSPGAGRPASAAPGSPGTNSAVGRSAQASTGATPPPVGSALTLGRADAPVTIVEFGDFQCTNCGAFARDTEPTLVRRYVDTGVVRLEWRDFPWVDDQSVHAAVAARAAGMQGKFWAYNAYLYAHQSRDEHSGLVTDAYLRSVARRLGLDMAAFNRDFARPALSAAVRADKAFGEGMGVSATPEFLIGGRPFFGAQPLSAFEAAIAQARGRQ